MNEKKVSPKKRKIVEEIKELLKKRSILVCSIKNIRASQLQQIRKKMRDKAIMKVARINLIRIAIEETNNENLKEVLKHINSDYILLFSDEDAFELSAFLAENKTPAKARPGQEAIEDIWIKAGPTNLAPGPDISLLSSVGLQPKVEGGKIAIAKDVLFIKKGEKVSEEKAAILAKLDITPFQVGLEPLIAFMNGKIYLDVKINKKEFLEKIKEDHSKAIALAVSIAYPAKEAIPFILGKAAIYEKVLNSLIKTKEGE
ncbi:MAG: 50S ribosomal protein L10 [Candidatus Pacearchaeota archaeon]